jgi:hypothetical protein
MSDATRWRRGVDVHPATRGLSSCLRYDDPPSMTVEVPALENGRRIIGRANIGQAFLFL